MAESMEDIEAIARRHDIDLSNVDVDSIQLPPGEDFGIKSDDDEKLYQEDPLEFEAGFGNVIVVDNLPVVPPEKFEKLEAVVKKIYSQIGTIKEGGVRMPVNPDTQKTLGYCFVEYNTPQEAELAREKTNGYKLDKSHIYAVNLFDDFEKYMNVPDDEWRAADIKPYTPGENLQQRLTDEKARDQFVIRAGSNMEVFLNDPRHLSILRSPPIPRCPVQTATLPLPSPSMAAHPSLSTAVHPLPSMAAHPLPSMAAHPAVEQ